MLRNTSVTCVQEEIKVDDKVDKKEEIVYYDTIFGKFEQPLIYVNIFFIALAHLITLYGILTFPFHTHVHLVPYTIVFATLNGIGTTGGVHRYYTHRSFKAKLPLQIIFLILYAGMGHNSLYTWVRDHRVHHKFSETDADPHNAKRGFFFAHVGWLMMKKHPNVTIKGKTVDMSDIKNDTLVQLYDRYFVLMKIIFCFTIPTIIPPLLWGETWYYSIMSQCFARYILQLNITWMINSAAHIYGTRPYDRTIGPTENDRLNSFCLGEQWHNFHHTFPWDYRASEMGRSNLTTYVLEKFAKIGWAYDLKSPSDELIRKVATKLGDGSHEKYGHIEIPEDENLVDEYLAKEL